MIDTRLHTLLTLMEAGSYTKAARVLSLTQPAVSHHIRQLEQGMLARRFFTGARNSA
ncbi:MAG: LysR family transcriptional regulator [Acutalibacteraceae bacterium]